MIIRMKGEPKELAEYMKEMQRPITDYGCELKEEIEIEAEAGEGAKMEVEAEVEKMFAEIGKEKSGTIYTELAGSVVLELYEEAKRKGIGVSALVAEIIYKYMACEGRRGK